MSTNLVFREGNKDNSPPQYDKSFLMFLMTSLSRAYQKAAENVYFAETVDEYFEYAKTEILGKGTHAIVDGQLTPLKVLWLDARFGATFSKAFAHLEEIQTGYGTWYRSKNRVKGIYPFKGFVTTKNWFGNEV